ncbi:MAG: ABC transporter permease [Desulfobacterales bacterium]|nr:MAG: ABC transporter permease [Desulfobacterales bacterium]
MNDGIDVKSMHDRGRTPSQWKYVLCIAPMAVFLIVTFFWPVARFLFKSVDNSDLVSNLPRTVIALADWKHTDGIPGEDVFAALVQDLADAHANGKDGIVAQKINQRVVGTRYLVIKTARIAAKGGFAKEALRENVLKRFSKWGNIELWSAIANDLKPLTEFYLLMSVDLQKNPDGHYESVPEEQAIFLQVFGRTVWISIVVTLICIVLALPVAHAIVAARPNVARVLITLILFPLWTSLLVRTIIWMILLQGNGPINSTLQLLGVINKPLNLIYTRFSLYVAMIQVLLPMMIFSIVAVMRRIPVNLMKAALSLGSPWLWAWWRVQLPLIMPGIFTGSAIVFVFALGYYITPALIGGPREQMISSFIAFYTNKTLNWGLASSLSIQLLFLLVLVWLIMLMSRFVFLKRTEK